MDQPKGKWEFIPEIGRKVWVPDEPAAAEPVKGHWRYVPLDPLNPNHVVRVWVPVDQKAAGEVAFGALADGRGEWTALPGGEVGFIPADQLERTIVIDGQAVRAYVPARPADHDHATERGEWVPAIVNSPRGPVRRQVFVAHEGPAPREAGFVTGAAACRLLGRSLSFLRALALRGEIETRTVGTRVLYRERDVAAVARGESPTRLRQAEAEEAAALMRGLFDGALPARSAGPHTPADSLAVENPVNKFISKYGR